MAGDWIKVECTTPDKPEIHAISQILGLKPDETLGKLIRIWAWADSNISDGCVKRFCNANVTPESIIDHVCGVTGFAEAMISVGWLERKNDSISFPSFDRHNGNPAKKRAETYRRVKRFRNASSVTNALPETETETNINSEKRKKFVPPTVEQVRTYCRERNNSIDPELFIAHYEANGWMQSKGKAIVSWEAAVRTWEKNSLNKQTKPPSSVPEKKSYLSQRRGTA